MGPIEKWGTKWGKEKSGARKVRRQKWGTKWGDKSGAKRKVGLET